MFKMYSKIFLSFVMICAWTRFSVASENVEIGSKCLIKNNDDGIFGEWQFDDKFCAKNIKSNNNAKKRKRRSSAISIDNLFQDSFHNGRSVVDTDDLSNQQLVEYDNSIPLEVTDDNDSDLMSQLDSDDKFFNNPWRNFISRRRSSHNPETSEEISSEASLPEDEVAEAVEPERQSTSASTQSQFSLQMPGFSISMFVPGWWKSGRNVCLRKNIKSENKTNDGSYGFNIISSTTSCSGSTDMFRCKLVNENITSVETTLLVWECCDGYTRQSTDEGCPRREAERKSFVETLQIIGANQTEAVMDLLNVLPPKMLSNFSQWTVFVPDNEAWILWQENVLKKMQRGFQLELENNRTMSLWMENTAKNILYHFVPKTLSVSSLSNDFQIPSFLEPMQLRTNIYNGGKLVTVNCAKLTKFNVKFNGGYIHLINKVISPPRKTVFEIAKDVMKNYPLLIEVIDEIKEELAFNGPYTFFLFVPTNSSNFLRNGKMCLKHLLRRGLVTNTLCEASLLQKTSRFKNVDGQSWNVIPSTQSQPGASTVDHSRIIKPDIIATDGVAHLLDKPLRNSKELWNLETFEHPLITTLLKDNVTNLLLSNYHVQPQTLLLPSIGNESAELFQGMDNKKLLSYIVPLRHSEESLAQTSLLETIDSGTSRHVEKIKQCSTLKPGFSIDCVQVQNILKTCNGYNVIQLLGNFPLQNHSLLDILKSNGDFSMMRRWFTKAGINQKNLSTIERGFKMAIVVLENNDIKKLKREIHLSRNSFQTFILSNFVHIQQGLCCDNFEGKALHIPYWLRGRYRSTLNYHLEPVKCNQVAQNGFLHVMKLRKTRRENFFSRDPFNFRQYWRQRMRLFMGDTQKMQRLRQNIETIVRNRQNFGHRQSNQMGFFFERN